jgi:DHA1 family tetracycline resistance protein-like MFS transporter
MPTSTRRQLLLIFGFVFLDLLGYSLILPLLPYYAGSFGASLTLVGLLGTVNALGQLVAAPVFGRLSDRHGRRPLLIFSLAGTVLSFVLLGVARSLAVIFVSRALDGLVGGNTSLARAYISDITDEQSRARGLGIIGAAFGLGFIIGPALGGFLSRYGYNVPALAAAGLTVLNLVAVIVWLPESHTAERRAAMRESPRTAFTLGNLWQALHLPCCGALLSINLLYALAFTLFQSNFSLWAKTRLQFTAQTTSYVLTYVGILAVLVQGLAIGRLTRRLRERLLILIGAAAMSIALLSWAVTPNLVMLLLILAPIALAGGVLNTVLSSQLTKAVTQEQVGGILGLSQSIQSLAQIIAPAAGGLLLERVGTWVPGATGSLLMALAAVFAWRYVASKQPLT